MKKLMILCTSAIFAMAIAVAPGCSGGDDDDDGGGDDDDGGGTLESGTYAATIVAPTASCNDNTYTAAQSFYAGATEADVTVNAGDFDIVFDNGFDTSYDITGNNLLDPASPPNDPADDLDWTDPEVYTSSGLVALSGPVDCVLSYHANYLGAITGDNEFTITDLYDFRVKSGAECNALVTSGAVNAIPCDLYRDGPHLLSL